MRLRALWLALVPLLAIPAFAQEILTLEKALELAKSRNGRVIAATLDVEAAKSRVRQSQALFLPTITPSGNYTNSRQEASGLTRTVDEFTTQIDASWRLLDNGERRFSLDSTKRSAEAQVLTARGTLRQVLFEVHQRYFDAVRSQALLRVATLQVERTQRVYDQTKARVEERDLAAVNLLQAEADLLNARVEVLTAQNQVTAADAELKAVLGFGANEELPPLNVVVATDVTDYGDLATLQEAGLKARPDLAATRKQLEAQGFQLERARRDAIFSFSVDASLTQQLTPDSLNGRSLFVGLNIPLYDGGRLREQARETELGIRANREILTQSERNARAEIEAAFKEYQQNNRRAEAAAAAVMAARRNYDAVVEAQRLAGANLVEVIQAQVSLVTAESNLVQALFERRLSEVRLRLVTGLPLQGESQS